MGSIPITRSRPAAGEKLTGFAHIAQAVEHFLGKEEVTGSSPVMGSRVKAIFLTNQTKA